MLLPLYPQYSTTTTASSLAGLGAGGAEGRADTCRRRGSAVIPGDAGFIAAAAAHIRETLDKAPSRVSYRLLLSAHGLPKRTIAKGDPYQWQVEQTAAAIVEALGIDGLDWRVCYQSRVGPLEWIGPATDAEIRRAGARRQGRDRRADRLCQRAFRNPGRAGHRICASWRAKAGVPDYLRVPHGGHTSAISSTGWPNLCMRAAGRRTTVTCGDGRICPADVQALRLRETMMDMLRNVLVQLHPLDQGVPYHRGDRLDGGHALSAAAVRLSHRDRAGLAEVASASR